VGGSRPKIDSVKSFQNTEKPHSEKMRMRKFNPRVAYTRDRPENQAQGKDAFFKKRTAMRRTREEGHTARTKRRGAPGAENLLNSE